MYLRKKIHCYQCNGKMERLPFLYGADLYFEYQCLDCQAQTKIHIGTGLKFYVLADGTTWEWGERRET